MATDQELTKIAHETALKMREFHLGDMKVMREYMDGRFDRVEDRIVTLETEMKQVKSALQVLLEEFRQHREDVTVLKHEVTDLRARLEVLEAKVLQLTT